MDTQDQQPERIVRTTITLPETLAKGIKDLAKTNDRPLSREIGRALKAHLETEGKVAA